MTDRLNDLLEAPGLSIVYDGECPLCRTYVGMLRVKTATRNVHLINAREDVALVQTCAARGYSLDEGMLAVYGTRFYYGSDAVALLSQLTTPSRFFNHAVARLLASPRRARALYPLLRAGRATALFMLGRPPLEAAGELESSRETR